MRAVPTPFPHKIKSPVTNSPRAKVKMYGFPPLVPTVWTASLNYVTVIISKLPQTLISLTVEFYSLITKSFPPVAAPIHPAPV